MLSEFPRVEIEGDWRDHRVVCSSKGASMDFDLGFGVEWSAMGDTKGLRSMRGASKSVCGGL